MWIKKRHTSHTIKDEINILGKPRLIAFGHLKHFFVSTSVITMEINKSPNEAKIPFHIKIVENSLIPNAKLTITPHF